MNLKGKQIGTILLCVDLDYTKLKPLLKAAEKEGKRSKITKMLENASCSIKESVSCIAPFTKSGSEGNKFDILKRRSFNPRNVVEVELEEEDKKGRSELDDSSLRDADINEGEVTADLKNYTILTNFSKKKQALSKRKLQLKMKKRF